MTTMRPIFIRTATAADQLTIKAMVRAARLNPFHLDWPRFIIAEERGQVVGIGQIKVLGDGTRELASLVTAPTHQGLGIGGAIVRTLQARSPGPLYLRCATHNVGFYQRFGFVDLTADAMPPDLRRTYLLVRRVLRVVNAVTRGDEMMHIMGWRTVG
jgi:N-acetylglutamate synthase-like GNAT family acetyltransferase